MRNRNKLMIVSILLLATSITACGSGDSGKAEASCANCSDTRQPECKRIAEECAKKGASESECQQVITIFCSVRG